KVKRITPAAPGAVALAIPNPPISARQTAMASRVPYRCETRGAGSANTPMQRTGIVVSSPATAWETPRSCWISGISGPTPTIGGRSARPARNRPASRPSRRCTLPGDDRVHQRAEPFDLDRDLVTGLHEEGGLAEDTDPGWGTRRD